MPLRDKAEPFVTAVLGLAFSDYVSVGSGAAQLATSLLPKADLERRTARLIDRMEKGLPDGGDVTIWEARAAQQIAKKHLSTVADLAASGADPAEAARALMEEGKDVIKDFTPEPREHVFELLRAFLDALRADPDVARDVQVRLQVLALQGIEAIREQLAEDERRRIERVVYQPGDDLAGVLGETEPLPSDLLNARYEVVPFYGREPELALLRAFRREPSKAFREKKDIGTFVIEGEGGLGKTRLGMEAVRRAEQEGWCAGFLPDSATPDVVREGLAALDRTGQRVFLVADYGEDRPEQVAAVIDAWRQSTADAPRRLVLLARQKALLDPRLDALAAKASELGPAVDYLKAAQAQTLAGSGLRVPPAERADVFREAQEAFAARLGRPMGDLLDPPDTLTRDPSEAETPEERKALARDYGHLGLPLYLHMAALASLDGRATVRKRDLLKVVLDKNWTYVSRLLDDVPALADLRITRPKLHDMLAVATLALAARPPTDDPAPDAAACAAPTALGRKAARDVVEDELAAFLTQTFGVAGPKRGRVMDALRPDALGEGLVFEALERTPSLLPPVLDMDGATRQSACTVLVRAALALATDPEPWLVARLGTDRLGADVALAFTLLRAIPDETVALRPLAAKLASFVAGSVSADDEAAQPLRASVLNVQGTRLSDIGNHEDALAATDKSVAIYRRLAARAPDVFESDLAASLGNLSHRLAAVGQRDDALRAMEEVMGIHRKLAEGTAIASEPEFIEGQSNLSKTLSNLGNRLSALGRRDDALAAEEEATAIRRRLAARAPDAFEPDLAASLSNLGVHYSAVGRRDDALAAEEEATAIRRRLAARAPDAFEPDLAASLSNLGGHYSAVGRRDDALAATEEASEIYRRLAARAPDAFEPDLARSLSNLGVHYSAVGRRDDALAATEEASEIYRRLAARAPDAFEPDLARSLSNLGVHYSAVGRRDDALAVTEEATAIRRRLAARAPDAFEPNLAASLSNLGVHYSAVGRRDDALAAEEEATAIRRRLAARAPDAFEPDLARSLSNLGIRLSAVGRREDALAAEEEATAIRRRLAARAPDAFEPDLAASLSNLGIRLSAVGRREDALAAEEEATAIRRRLAARAPDAFEPDLAASLSNLGIRLSAVGRREDALAAEEEATAIRRRLAARAPDAHEPDLARSLSNLGDRQMETDAPEAAVASYAESLRLLSRFVQALPDAFRDLTMATLQDYVKACEATETEPDMALLVPILQALGFDPSAGDAG